ncbi:MAG: sulfatase [Capsulimonadaceae bacterium]|nr:sulfatase [Capsulimonadaceae bacterium]
MRILYIDIDSLRPDHLGCYGYHRNTSPNIDAIAADGVRFDQVFTPDAPCLPSRTAFYSGRFGIATGVVGHGGSAAQPKIEGSERWFRDLFDTQGLAGRLQNQGYHTAMISPFGQRHAAHWFYAGFNEVHNTGMGGMESAEHIQPVVDKWLDANCERDNWYLHINYWDPHTPYRAPLSFGEPFADAPLPEWLDDDDLIRRHNALPGPHTSLDIAMYDDSVNPNYPRQPGKITDRASMRKMIDGYDTGVLYADWHVGKIVERLKEAGVWDDTAVVISADHGENQGELGIYGEHGTADVPTCRIPMIVRWPGGAKGVVDKGLHYNLDLAPTYMDLLGSPPAPIWDGVSFAPSILGGQAPGRDELVISQCCHVCQRSVRWDNWLYMRTYHDGFHDWPSEMLFDLAQDPHEQNDIAASRPDVCAQGAWRLERWHDQQMSKVANSGTDAVDPLWTVVKEGGPFHARHGAGNGPLPAYIKRLRATGRSVSADRLEKRYARWL